MFAGIDPGKDGGWAILRPDGSIYACDKFRGWKMSGLTKNLVLCCIEKVQSRSGQGVKSVFTFGMNYGGWLALLETHSIPHELIPPQRWQKKFLGHFPSGQSKQRSVDFINRRYPKLQLRSTQHGISDAICLALYAIVLHRRLHGNSQTKRVDQSTVPFSYSD